LRLAGAIEPFPGREPSPKFLHDLISTTKRLQIKALFTEPQLPERPARVMAEAAGIPVYQLDPEGGQEGLRSYSEIILYNARTLSTALK
jgi:ABC-type Zn uptake system ZnuABC Zn-binding protein ZnuA